MANFLSSGLACYLRNVKAATAIEYGIIAGLISLGILTAVFMTGGSLSSIFGVMVTRMASVLATVSP